MARKTRAELAREVQELQERIAQPPSVYTFTIVYTSEGAIVNTANTPLRNATDLAALKRALSGVAQYVDGLLLQAVQNEAAQKAQTQSEEP